jgi:hypothetical protein
MLSLKDREFYHENMEAARDTAENEYKTNSGNLTDLLKAVRRMDNIFGKANLSQLPDCTEITCRGLMKRLARGIKSEQEGTDIVFSNESLRIKFGPHRLVYDLCAGKIILDGLQICERVKKMNGTKYRMDM